MPSPFPGMDPYLEGSLWTTLHFSLNAEIVCRLAPVLRPRYLVLPVERIVVKMPASVTIEIRDAAERQGKRVPMQKPLPVAPYFVFLSRAEKRPLTDIWPIALDQPLPTIPVPLLPGDADIPLDLQAVFTATYDLLGYDLAIDYSAPPEVPLSGEAAEWAAQFH